MDLEFASHPIFQWLMQYAYQPGMVYTAVIVMMLASGFGFPLPEEVTIISVGILAFIGANPSIFPPPEGAMSVVNPIHASIITFLAVLSADLLIYSIGKTFGKRLLKHQRFKKMIPDHFMERVNQWTARYGILAVGIFRFTPGIRFPGHIACGMLGIPLWKFFIVDGLAALISVPTQILLVSHFGEPIIKGIQEFKLYVFALIGIILISILAKRLKAKFST